MEICSRASCTGCGACANACPKGCIAMAPSKTGALYPEIDDNKCIKCGKCKRICPQVEKVSYNKPTAAYAAWSLDKETRRTSASGGIAAEMYSMALQKGMMVAGAETAENHSVRLVLTDDEARLRRFKNSKYVFSEPYSLYDEIRDALKNGRSMLIIGLPCQIAAVRRLFGDNERLVLAEVVCHGITPVKYLRQHISSIENKIGEHTSRISFRDPECGTAKYYFSLYNSEDKRFYSKRTMHGDTYQIGYHRAISYRENCYHCIYARGERVSDITLSDYKGLGKLAPCSYGQEKVSSVLINTEKGRAFFDELVSSGRIFAERRPTDEPIKGDTQMQHPSVKSPRRHDFEKYIEKYNGDFEKTMKAVNVRHKLRLLKGKVGKIWR